ncbi:penicillin-binding protein activator [Spongiibacter sp. KMU-158]|uniref:Penicillin-binding protein activator n=1 Tax=Spongiibacter pelagi TaxID=2760804 RepID=A0A927GXS9_9GAMM|nr:penicillin-binding protein activator [Spongiibacter pelagi]MBD2859729.1 penicillin-binding protein activator [Spongiibacter pelagi]
MMTRYLLLTALSTLIVACSSTPETGEEKPPTQPYEISSPQDYPSYSHREESDYLGFNPATANSADIPTWLQQAITATPTAAAELRLRAAEVLLRDGEAAQADTAVSELTLPELLPEHALRLAIAQARILRTYSKFSEALGVLADPLLNNYLLNAPAPLQILFSHLRASLFAIEGNQLAAIRERIYMNPLLSPTQADANREQIWQLLLQVPATVLTNNITSVADKDYLGWLELALIAKSNSGNIDAQIERRNQWLARWPGHPARRGNTLPGELHQLDELALDRAQQIALILPMTGKLARYGKAARDGYLAASLESKQSGAPIPTLRVYDAENKDVKQLYQQALNDGAELIIGPLSKTNLAELAQAYPNAMPRPTIALNRLETAPYPRGLYQLSLSPEDEAQQIAEISREKGLERVLILSPEGDWGNKVADAFSERWLTLGGQIVQRSSFNARANDYSKQIKSALQLNQSENRLKRLRQIIGLGVKFEPHRRDDVDFIFLVARPSEGRAIVPLFAYHYAGDLPVYATSHIYPGAENTVRDRDINNVLFVDIPWVLNTPSELHKTIVDGLADSEDMQRMYALGVDSFRLTLRLKQLQQPGNQIFGETGRLSLNENRQILRHLSPAKMAAGKAVLNDANSPTSLPQVQ